MLDVVIDVEYRRYDTNSDFIALYDEAMINYVAEEGNSNISDEMSIRNYIFQEHRKSLGMACGWLSFYCSPVVFVRSKNRTQHDMLDSVYRPTTLYLLSLSSKESMRCR